MVHLITVLFSIVGKRPTKHTVQQSVLLNSVYKGWKL
jgi:hypothetical protein